LNAWLADAYDNSKWTNERRPDDVYVTEKIEAYNVAIEALLNHEPADGDPTGLARRLRRALARKLDREIQRWCDALPPNDKLKCGGEKKG
jgi:hypothetical protein